MDNERKNVGQKAESFFDELWKRGDPWSLETSEFERAKYERQIALLSGRRYARALEIGCGGGSFTRFLSRVVDRIVAVDISPTAVARAHATATGCELVDFRVANIMEYDLQDEGPWDLIVMSETIYYLGWLYSFLTWHGSPCSCSPRPAAAGNFSWLILAAVSKIIFSAHGLFVLIMTFLLTSATDSRPRKFSAEQRMALTPYY